MTKVIYNGKIYCGRKKFCDALIIDKGRIHASGTKRELLLTAPKDAERIDAEGALVLPAFHDSHLHLMWAGRRESGIECAGAKSVEEVVQRGRELIARVKPAPGAYIQGNGVNPDLFSEGEKRELRREDVDKISTVHPVVLSRHCGHTIYCNSAALKLAGLSDSAPQVEGGTAGKDEHGRPTGVFSENGSALIRRSMPAYSGEDMKAFLRLAMKKAHSLGITSCGSYDTDGTDFENIVGVYRETYDEFRAAGVPGLRVSMQCGVCGSEDILEARLGRDRSALWEDPLWGSFLKASSVKLFADGTLGAHTAWMRQPYRDRPGSSGFPVLDQAFLDHVAQKASDRGVQVLVHAIGDACMDSVLSAFEKVTAPGKNPCRHGIIHCQVTDPAILKRMAANRILALVQPVFLADDRHILESRIGPELASTSYAWASMLRCGIPVSFSTDAPVSPMDPLSCIEWAVLRKDSGDPQSSAFYPDECVDIHSAVDAYTQNSVYANFDETTLGRIEPGRCADLVFLDRDLFTIPPEEIHKTRVLKTMCAGELVYEA